MCIVVTHDPREALYMGQRIIVLNRRAAGEAVSIVLDERVGDSGQNPRYVNINNHEQEERLIAALERP
jgi:ABC-type nitrate/sulfonate/bicarbonate transport system ATPase subunit